MNFEDENGIRRTISISRKDTIEAVKNDYSEIIKRYNPNIVSFNRCQTKAGEALRLEVTVHAPSHYLTKTNGTEPKPCDSMSATILVKTGYPVTSIEAFYDPDHYLASPNVFRSGHACIDTWVPFKSSLVTVVDKLVRDMIHDPEVTRYDSMANHAMESWHKKGARENRFSTIDPHKLYKQTSRALPPKSANKPVARTIASALPPKGH